MGGSYDEYFYASGLPEGDHGFGFATVQGYLSLGGDFWGQLFGVRGAIGVAGETGPYPTIRPIGVFGTARIGAGVVGTSFDSGVIGQSGDVFVPSPSAGVVGSSQDITGVSGVSSLGTGVWGASDTGPGVSGHSNKASAVIGITGQAFGTTGAAGVAVVGVSNTPGPQFADSPAGVVGTSAQDHGVRGTSSNSWGVVGISSNASGALGQSGAPPTISTPTKAGVVGASRDSAGVCGVSDTNAGVFGSSKSVGVRGECQGAPWGYAETNAGVLGASNATAGVYGVSNTAAGVVGTSTFIGVGGTGEGRGVFGSSNQGVGVHGDSTSNYGVFGGSATYTGVFGYSVDLGPSVPSYISVASGVYGVSSMSHGVTGVSADLGGVVGYSKNGPGVYGESGGTGASAYAGYFNGNIYVSGQILGNNKSAIVPFGDGSHRLMHCMESPEHWFEDFGTARLKRGHAVIKLDADFAKAIKTGDYLVFLTPEGDCGGLYIKNKRGDGFEVRELQGGASYVAFSYRIVGRRRDIKRHQRFARINVTSPLQTTKRRTTARKPVRPEVFTRKFRAALAKQAAAPGAKSRRGRNARLRRQSRARA